MAVGGETWRKTEGTVALGYLLGAFGAYGMSFGGMELLYFEQVWREIELLACEIGNFGLLLLQSGQIPA